MLQFFRILTVFAFLFTSNFVFGQKDVIITNAGEEIRCKILDETPSRFKYAYVGPKNKVLRNEIFKNLVSSFKYGYYENDLLTNEKQIVRAPLNSNPPIVKEEAAKEAEKELPKNTPVKTEPKVVAKDTPAKPETKVVKEAPSKTVVKEVPAKDLARDLNKPSYPVNNQNNKPVSEPVVKKEEVLVPVAPVKKETETPKAVVENKPVKEEAKPAKVEEPKTVVTSPKKDDKTPKLDPKEVIKPIVKPEIVKAEPKIPEKILVPVEKTGSEVTKPVEVPQKQTDVKVVNKPTTPKSEPVAVSKPEEIKPIEKKVEPKPEKKEEINVVLNEKAADNKNPEKKVEPIPANALAKFDQKKPNAGYKNYMKFRIGVKGGLGNIVNKTEDTSPFGLYQEKLQRGWILGGDATYFVKDWLGFGVKYASFQTNNSDKKLDFPNPISSEPVKSGSLSNKVSHKFVGPSVVLRKSIDFKTYIVMTASPGVHLYSDKGTLNANNFKLTGQSYGGNATLGLDFLLGNDIFGRDIILSIEGGYNYGSVNKLVVGGTNEKKSLATPINLNRLDFGVGLRFTRFPMYLR